MFLGSSALNIISDRTRYAHAADVSYVYDKLGRLRAVIDPASDTAIYSYDSVGNLLSIARQSASQVAVIEFTPDSGLVGSVVTISGTAFSTTPSQNAVTFNGTVATVTSSTTTQIVTAVPAGATTGPIAVTTPSGSATSSTPFTVQTSTGAPTIAGFSPTIGTAGTSITVTGANFDATVANNSVRLNVSYATVASATPTSITTTVPGVATSGRISVATPLGKAVGADFFVPPSPYTATDVQVTDRMTIGGTKTVAITTANKVGLILFDGTIGQRVSLNVTGASISVVTIYNPDGTTLTSGTTSAFGAGFLDPKTVPITGTYTILVDPLGTNTFTNGTLTLYDVPPDVSGTITPGGPAVTVSTTTPGQNVRLTFAGTAGQRVSLNVTNGSLSTVSIFNPDGSTLTSGATSAFGAAFLDTKTLPATGTYTILLDPLGANTVTNATLTLYDVPPDVTGTVTIGGSAVPVTIATPGQNASLTFAGTAGQQVTVRITGNTMGNVTVKLLKPDNTVLTSTTSTLSNFNLATQTLPTTGTYTITIDPLGANVGSMNVSVTSP